GGRRPQARRDGAAGEGDRPSRLSDPCRRPPDRRSAQQNHVAEAQRAPHSGEGTSGPESPSLGEPIGRGYVATGDAEAGTMIDVEIRGQRVPAEVVALPFYRRARGEGGGGGRPSRHTRARRAARPR